MKKVISTYRLSKELDDLITKRATELVISKNDVVQLELMKALKQNEVTRK